MAQSSGGRKAPLSNAQRMSQTPQTIVERRTEIVFPTDVNHYGTLFGGKAVAMMDVVASIAAMRASKKPVVTASIDRVDFKAPIREGDFVETIARVVAIGRTSVTVEVELWGEIPATGERKLSTVGKFVLVAIDRDGRPTPITS
ncbi:MAG TPA: acyl-CoA thioesterase [Candidatus Baltobacteraceae bacterium]